MFTKLETTLDEILKYLKKDEEKKELVTAVKLYKNGDDWYLLGIYSNYFEDREGEIITEAAHKEYAEWINETGFQPALTIYHMPRVDPDLMLQAVVENLDNIPRLQEIVDTVYRDFAIGRTEKIFVIDGFSIVSGKVYNDKVEIAKKALSEESGMSHGFILLEDDGNLLEKYRSFEQTILPRMRAANFFTLPMVTGELDEI